LQNLETNLDLRVKNKGDFGYNMYDMPLRDYDPAIGRWVVQDPVIHHSQSTYSSFNGNPVVFADPSGGAGQGMIDRNFPSQYDDNGNKILPNGFLPDDDDDDFDFHDGGSNRESDDFHFDLEDDNSITICDTCPNTKEFEKYINDPINNYYYDSATGLVSNLLEEVVIVLNCSKIDFQIFTL
jgi:RHS repeat-associated protein